MAQTCNRRQLRFEPTIREFDFDQRVTVLRHGAL